VRLGRLGTAAVATLAVLGAFAGGADAAGPGGWQHVGDAGTPGTKSLNGNVLALNASAPGQLLVGGEFTDAGGNTIADRIARTDGINWAEAGSASDQINGGVMAVAYYQGNIFVGGSFVNAGGNANADFLAVWNGVTWAPFCTPTIVGPSFNGNVRALQVVGDKLYVGGEFQDAAGISNADYLAECDISSGVASATFANPNQFFSGPVLALTADTNGVLYAGGRFNDLASVATADNVAYYSSGTWNAMGSGSTACQCAIDGYVRALTAVGTDVYVGTDVKDVAGIAQADNVARWNGTAWSAVGSNSLGTNGWFPASTFIYALTGFGGKLYATGAFQDADGDPTADNVATFDGSAWHPVGSNGAGNGPWVGEGHALAVLGNSLFAGGSFTSAGGDPQARSIASFALAPTVTPAPSPAPTPAEEPERTLTITSGPAEGSSIRDNTPTFEFSTNDPWSLLSCVPTGATAIIETCASPFTTSQLADGSHKFTVRAYRGGQSLTSEASRTFTVDTTRPAAQLSGATLQTAGSTLGVTVSCSTEACQAVASGTVSVPGAARVFKLRTATRKLAKGVKAKLKLRVPKPALAAVRNALAHHRKVSARIVVRVTDKAGNAGTSRRSVKLRR
jgi:hypothetical protein